MAVQLPHRSPECRVPRFQICYRCTTDRGATALIVADERAIAYLFCAGGLQARLGPHQPCERLVRLLERCGRWVPVPSVAPYTLGELRELVKPRPAATVPHRGSSQLYLRRRNADIILG